MSSTCRSKETRAGSAFVREPNGDGIAPLVYPIGLLPIDLIQEFVVDPRSGDEVNFPSIK